MSWKHNFKHVDVSNALKFYVEETFQKEERFLLKDSQWQIFYSKGKHKDCHVLITVKNGNGHFKASASGGTFYEAVDKTAEKLSKQFQRKKEKLQQHKDFSQSKQGKLRRLNSRLEYDNSPFPSKKTA